MQALDLLSGLVLLSVLGCVLFFGYLWATERKAPEFSDSIKHLQRSKETPSLTVIVTARNEEETIGRCLSSLVKQTYPELEILVVDDSSKDRTREVVEEYVSKTTKIRPEDAGPKPAGWVGKSWPCWRGYELSRSGFLLFVDADSWFEPESIELAMNYILSSDIDVLSISPKIEMKGVWAKAVVPIITGAINLLYPMAKVNDEKSDRAYVFGTFILLKTEVYKSIGGHARVKDEIVEDAAIAKLAKSSGRRVRVEIGTRYLTTEWESNPSAIYNGLERVASTSIRSYGLVSLLNAVLLFFVGLYPLIFFVGSSIAILLGNGLGLSWLVGLAASVLGIVCFVALTSMELKLVRGSVGLAPLLYPLGVCFFIAAIITTSFKVFSGKTFGWKGSEYPVERAPSSDLISKK